MTPSIRFGHITGASRDVFTRPNDDDVSESIFQKRIQFWTKGDGQTYQVMLLSSACDATR
jgi:hypothetical protein